MSGDADEERLVRLARLSVAVVQGDWSELAAVRRGAPAGEPDRAWREALLQTYLFAGFPRVVEALRVLGRVGGLGRPAPDELQREDASRGARGRALFDRIYADQADEVRGQLEASHPDLARWIEEHAYGSVLAREGLSPAARECLAVACLAALGQRRQLASHQRGAVRCGASPRLVRRVLEAVGDALGEERLREALEVADAYAPLPPGGAA